LAGTIHFMDRHDCPFCRLERNRIRLESEFAVSFLDGFPITQGHTLVIPKRHVVSLFELPDEEQAAIWKLVTQVRASLAAELQPDGFNVGFNDGTASGQTVMHAHVHIIPRYIGDVTDPRGGVRWIMPDKARYWDEDQK
jgi:diadenosine tetraphosphate (Ap4A) HIT family hydrolase